MDQLIQRSAVSTSKSPAWNKGESPKIGRQALALANDGRWWCVAARAVVHRGSGGVGEHKSPAEAW